MSQNSVVDPQLRAIASALPEHHWSTEELLAHAGDRLSPKLVGMMHKLGVDNGKSSLATPADATALLMHTGSKHILDGLFGEFDVPTDSATVSSSYRVLREYGNTIGCSVRLMLDEQTHRPEGGGAADGIRSQFLGGCPVDADPGRRLDSPVSPLS
jgi:3-oxoacyl-[acyl-carrier-protein] synthase III